MLRLELGQGAIIDCFCTDMRREGWRGWKETEDEQEEEEQDEEEDEENEDGNWDTDEDEKAADEVDESSTEKNMLHRQWFHGQQGCGRLRATDNNSVLRLPARATMYAVLKEKAQKIKMTKQNWRKFSVS